MNVDHRATAELEAGLPHVRLAPADLGPVEMIVRRPEVGQREVVAEARLDTIQGLVGDNWLERGSRHTPDGAAHPDAQLTIMGLRAIALISQDASRWPLAGDQLFVDLDLSTGNLPAGSRLSIGTTIVEITPQPHTGCKHFATRFGKDAVKFVNSPEGKQLRLRGLNARIVQSGMIRVGDVARKL